MTTTLDVIDSAIKIGLGALIAGVSAFITTAKNHSFEKFKQSDQERRNLAKDLATKLEKVAVYSNEAAFHYHHNDISSAKKSLIPAADEIYSCLALSNILGDDVLLNIIEKMSDSIDSIYQELNKENPDEDKIGVFSDQYISLKKLAYINIREAYKGKKA